MTDNGAGLPVPRLAGAGFPRGPPRRWHGLGATRPAAGAGTWTAAGSALARLRPLPRSSAGAGTGSSACASGCSLLGGEFSAGPLPGYGFQVSARIPLPACGERDWSGAMTPLRVVVADDQALVRVGFCGIISATPGFIVVGEAGNGAEAVEAARRARPDVILMDVRMPVMDGIEATRQITASTDVRALILTTFDLDEYVFAALRAGASGFLLKDTLPADLLTAIRVVAAGDALLAPSVTRRLIGEFARTSSGRRRAGARDRPGREAAAGRPEAGYQPDADRRRPRAARPGAHRTRARGSHHGRPRACPTGRSPSS